MQCDLHSVGDGMRHNEIASQKKNISLTNCQSWDMGQDIRTAFPQRNVLLLTSCLSWNEYSLTWFSWHAYSLCDHTCAGGLETKCAISSTYFLLFISRCNKTAREHNMCFTHFLKGFEMRSAEISYQEIVHSHSPSVDCWYVLDKYVPKQVQCNLLPVEHQLMRLTQQVCCNLCSQTVGLVVISYNDRIISLTFFWPWDEMRLLGSKSPSLTSCEACDDMPCSKIVFLLTACCWSWESDMWLRYPAEWHYWDLLPAYVWGHLTQTKIC